MFAAILTNRAIVAVGGADARRVSSTGPAHQQPDLGVAHARLPCRAPDAAGKLVAEMFVTELPAEEGRLLLDVARPQADELATKLAFYRLRAAVTVRGSAGRPLSSRCGARAPPVPSPPRVPDPRLRRSASRVALDSGRACRGAGRGGSRTGRRARLARPPHALGVPEPGADFIVSETFPHERTWISSPESISARACFVGQEVVSRMQHRARRAPA